MDLKSTIIDQLAKLKAQRNAAILARTSEKSFAKKAALSQQILDANVLISAVESTIKGSGDRKKVDIASNRKAKVLTLQAKEEVSEGGFLSESSVIYEDI